MLVVGILWSLVAAASASAAEQGKTLLLLPVAGGTPGQEWSAKALGGILEDGFRSVRSVRLLTGTAREVALRELSASATVTPEEFREICRRAGADLALLGGSTLVDGRLALEIRIFDVAAARELLTFRGEEPSARAFELAAAAIRHVAAEAALGSANALFPGGVTVSLEAYAAYRAALIEEAPAARVEKLRGVLALDADYADPTLRLGVELFRLGSLDEAMGVLERAVALAPKVAEARNNYGVALAAAGRPEQAQRQFEEAVALAPEYAEARLNLARVFEDRGRSSDAERQYTAILEADAGNDKARAGLAALYDGTGRPELAIREFRLLSPRRPDLAEGEFLRSGQEARKAREYARAEKFFLRAADVNPQFAQAWAELGTNSYLAGEYSKGVEYFRKALAIDPGQAAFHYYLALALDKDRQQDEALREYRRAVELGGPPEARLGLARAALEAGDPGLAVEELNRLLVASPDNAEAKTMLAQATGEMEARRRLVEGQSQFANQRLARLEQIVADANRANRELEARLQAVTRDKQAQGGIDAAPGELAAEREARRREAAEAQTALALLRTEKERSALELAEARERLKREAERFQAELAAAQARILELGRGSGEVAEMRERLAGLQADLARAQTESGQQREAHRLEAGRVKAEQAAGEAARGELAKLATESAELKGRLLAAQGATAKAEEGQKSERERGERVLAEEREARRTEGERFKSELAASEAARGELGKKVTEAAEVKGQLLAAQGAIARAEEAQRAERNRGERALAAEREDRRVEVEKLRAELAAAQFKRQEKERLLQDLAAEKARTLAAQAAREKAERAQELEREARRVDVENLKTEATAERASRKSEVEKLRAELAAAVGRAQDRDRLAQEIAAERKRALAEQAAREKIEQTLADQRAGGERALAAERLRGEQAAAAERVESRRQGALTATRVAALETQAKTLAESLQTRDAELAAARSRESAVVASQVKGQADLDLLAERLAALESRAAMESRTLAERERDLEKARLAVRELALELGRIALRTQSWEKARGYLEQAVEVDPRSGEAWYGLGEALFQLGQYEKSKQMYDKAKQIY